MQKKQKQIILLLVLTVLAAAALFGISRLPAKTSEPTLFLNAMDADHIDLISYQYEGATITLSKDEQGIWTAPSQPQRKLRQPLCLMMVTQSGRLQAEDYRSTYTGSLADYGLQPPANRIVVGSGAEKTVYLIGEQNAATGDYYLQVEGETGMYTVSEDFVSAFYGDYPYLTDPEG